MNVETRQAFIIAAEASKFIAGRGADAHSMRYVLDEMLNEASRAFRESNSGTPNRKDAEYMTVKWHDVADAVSRASDLYDGVPTEYCAAAALALCVGEAVIEQREIDLRCTEACAVELVERAVQREYASRVLSADDAVEPNLDVVVTHIKSLGDEHAQALDDAVERAVDGLYDDFIALENSMEFGETGIVMSNFTPAHAAYEAGHGVQQAERSLENGLRKKSADGMGLEMQDRIFN